MTHLTRLFPASGLLRVVLLTLLLACSSAFAAAGPPAKATYDIPAGPALETFKTFAEQSGKQLLYSVDAVTGVQTRAVKGEMSVTDALDRMLADTGLIAVRDAKTGAIAVRKESDAEKNDPRTAQKDSDRPTSQSKVEEGKVVLDKFEVMGTKLLNMDKPRSRNDAQPYVILGRDQIEQSGAVNLQDFLKQRLTMNTQAGTNSTSSAFAGSLSSINLRGLGTNQTLILVDGHRSASFGQAGNQLQSDLSGIPLSAVERIEVLPTTASGIYGGSATGGVVNIVLRRDYAGVEVKATYENTFDTDIAIKRVDLSAGLTLEGGKTNLLLASSYSEGDQLLLRDRDFLLRGRARILANNPAGLLNATSTPLGSTPNIRSSTGANLVLRDGTPLNAAFTYVPKGYAGYATDGGAGLLANAGKYNLELASADNNGGGLGLTNGPVTRTISLTARRQFSPNFQAFIELGASDNTSFYSISAAGQFTVAATAPGNPFQQVIVARVPLAGLPSLLRSENISRRAVGGLIFRLPWKWTAEADYTWNRVKFGFSSNGAFLSTATTAINNGTVNVVVDTTAHPVDMTPYVASLGTPNGPFASTMEDATIRLAGPVLKLPGGEIQAAVAVEHLTDKLSEGAQTIDGSTVNVYPARSRKVDSAYVEFRVPLGSGPRGSRTYFRDLELQLAGRWDSYTINGATNSVAQGSTIAIARATGKMESTNPTVGLKYKPVQDLALRGSYGTGFLPPSTSNVLPSLQTFASTVTDPKRGNASTSIQGANVTIGGDPNLGPEKSNNWSVGVVLTPHQVKGLRVSLDYTRIHKTDNITTLTAQQIVDNEVLFAGRVTRAAPVAGDPYPVGVITALNISSVNIAQAIVDSYDAAVDYSTGPTGFGTFDVFAMATWQTHYQTQLLSSQPIVENAGIAGSILTIPVKFKTVGGLTWKRGRFSAGVTTRYFDSYLASTNATTIVNQGNGGRVSSQIYHDVFAGYRFARATGPRKFLGGSELTVGVKNLFNAAPPFDAGNTAYYYSMLGDPRMAAYYITLKRAF